VVCVATVWVGGGSSALSTASHECQVPLMWLDQEKLL
jgi:hypothetical protein